MTLLPDPLLTLAQHFRMSDNHGKRLITDGLEQLVQSLLDCSPFG